MAVGTEEVTMATVASRSAPARKTVRSKPEPPTTAASRPSEDDIRLLAYRLYEMRSTAGIDGDADADWIEAERLLINDGELSTG
jgi:Protein of unknown function (DUF2934)